MKELRNNQRKWNFTNNYEYKYHEEIQSAHFGASKSQITIHAAVLYCRDIESDIKCQSFVTKSQSLRHDACTVWANLFAMLEEAL